MSRQLTMTEEEEVSEHLVKSHYYNSLINKMCRQWHVKQLTMTEVEEVSEHLVKSHYYNSLINKMCRQWHVKTVDNNGSGGGK